MNRLRMTLVGMTAVLAASAGGPAFARPMAAHHRHHPLTVHRHTPGPADVVAAPLSIGLGIAGGVVAGAVAPLGFFGGGYPEPPLPIKARYAGAGPQVGTVYEGWKPDVPLDHSGPIYMLDPDAPKLKLGPF